MINLGYPKGIETLNRSHILIWYGRVTHMRDDIYYLESARKSLSTQSYLQCVYSDLKLLDLGF